MFKTVAPVSSFQAKAVPAKALAGPLSPDFLGNLQQNLRFQANDRLQKHACLCWSSANRERPICRWGTTM
jgi:hypothetical protein